MHLRRKLSVHGLIKASSACLAFWGPVLDAGCTGSKMQTSQPRPYPTAQGFYSAPDTPPPPTPPVGPIGELSPMAPLMLTTIPIPPYYMAPFHGVEGVIGFDGDSDDGSGGEGEQESESGEDEIELGLMIDCSPSTAERSSHLAYEPSRDDSLLAHLMLDADLKHRMENPPATLSPEAIELRNKRIRVEQLLRDRATPRIMLEEKIAREMVRILASRDSKMEAEQAALEAGKKSEDQGGLWTVSFAGDAQTLGDLNPANFDARWKEMMRLRPDTMLVPGFNKLLEKYLAEFGKKPTWPRWEVLILTDGEARDIDAFIAKVFNTVSQYPQLRLTIIVGVVGDDAPHRNLHQRALDSFDRARTVIEGRVAELHGSNQWQSSQDLQIAIHPLTGLSDAKAIAANLLAMDE